MYEARKRKAPVVALVERNGRARSFFMDEVTAKNLRAVLKGHVEEGAALMTDDSGLYNAVRGHFGSHDVVTHSMGEYSRRLPGRVVHTNTVEGLFSILKRGVMGTFHHLSKRHLQRYLNEFDFRYSARDVSDGERTTLAIQSVTGKRLTYHRSVHQ